jgi:UDP-N-acetylmuramate--alanine ligase
MLNFDRIHFIGIGGIGISALAHWALQEGKQVTGSDVSDSALIQDLKRRGAKITLGHWAENLKDDTELAVFTEAIDPKTNPEYARAKELGIPTMSYFQALGELANGHKVVAVTGTKGKTTTTAMLGLALIAAGLDPTVIVGSKVREFGNTNFRMGKSDLFVVEACEYRRSFLNLEPFGMVLLNCQPDHLDYYKDEKDYVSAYTELAQKIPKEGFLVYNRNDGSAHHVAKKCDCRTIPATLSEAHQAKLKLQVLGGFNVLNAFHALKAAEALGADGNKVKKALSEFRGAWRRMEYRGTFQGAPVYDDYGHHPMSIVPTLKAFKEANPNKRLICVYQPHQYSRTFQLLDGFAKAFGPADWVIIPNIYPARDTEEDKKKIDAERLVSEISKHHPRVIWGKDFETTYDLLKKEVTRNDVVVIMGAGDVTELADRLASQNHDQYRW